MHYDDPGSFHELCARALRDNDLETVAEVVDRILCAANENVKTHSEPRNRRPREM